jgi:BirA family biotin operon repressor/biotin-[acetyl-CoA-carboxylase] ligase
MQFDIRKIDTTPSTNDEAKQAAAQGAAEGLVIQALSQSAGRGRQGRQWQSPAGNLYCSVLLRPRTEQRHYGLCSFIAALAIRDAVHAFLPKAAVELKWPNDVLVNGKKISGILLEAGDGWLVVGMGINVEHMPGNPLYPVTSLAGEQSEASVDQILAKLLVALGFWYETLENQGFAPIRAAWLIHARKGAMRVRLPAEETSGEFVDLDDQGNLHLLLSNGTKRLFNTGDVFFLV